MQLRRAGPEAWVEGWGGQPSHQAPPRELGDGREDQRKLRKRKEIGIMLYLFSQASSQSIRAMLSVPLESYCPPRCAC